MEINPKTFSLLTTQPYEPKPIFPELGDYHTANATAFYGFDYMKDLYFNDPKTFKEKRSIAKAQGLAINYGGSAYNIRQALNCSDAEAERLFNNYLKNLPVFKEHLDKLTKKGEKDLGVYNMVGRFIPIEILDRKKYEWKIYLKGKRNLYNYPIQSLGAELIRIIMVKVGDYVEKNHIYKWQGNNICNAYIKRIVCITPEQVTPELGKALKDTPTGHTKVLVVETIPKSLEEFSGVKVLQEYDRGLKLSMAQINSFGMSIVW